MNDSPSDGPPDANPSPTSKPKRAAKPKKPTRAEREASERRRYEAQEYVFQAMEARSVARVTALCRKALEIDPDCSDAIVLLAKTEKLSNAQFEQRLRTAIQAAERALGADAFRELRGMFWGFTETRPYMRARIELANLLAESRPLEALAEYEALLELNTDDNNGLRYIVVALHLQLGNLDKAARWLKRYDMDDSAFFTWAAVLHAVASGNESAATKALKLARESNAFAEAYLSGRKTLPKTPPPLYSPGSDDEGQLAARELLPAYQAHPKVMAWLIANAPDSGKTQREHGTEMPGVSVLPRVKKQTRPKPN